jgi:hypothetical protein
MLARWLLALGLVSAALLGTATPAAEAVCQRPEPIRFSDQNVGTTVEVSILKKTIAFRSSEIDRATGLPLDLQGTEAKIRDDGRHLDATYVDKDVSITLRADLPYGRARAHASKIYRAVNPPRVRGVPWQLLHRTAAKIWALTVVGGPSAEGSCLPASSPGAGA